MSAQSVEVPFRMMGNRRCLTDQQIQDDPCLAAFVNRFTRCFERDPLRCIYILDEAGEGPKK